MVRFIPSRHRRRHEVRPKLKCSYYWTFYINQYQPQVPLCHYHSFLHFHSPPPRQLGYPPYAHSRWFVRHSDWDILLHTPRSPSMHCTGLRKILILSSLSFLPSQCTSEYPSRVRCILCNLICECAKERRLQPQQTQTQNIRQATNVHWAINLGNEESKESFVKSLSLFISHIMNFEPIINQKQWWRSWKVLLWVWWYIWQISSGESDQLPWPAFLTKLCRAN